MPSPDEEVFYDPSNDMAGFTKVYDKYVQAVASTYRPQIDDAITHATDLENRAARARAYWQRLKDKIRK